MVEKCPAKYKNLNYIQSFSEQGYATIQLMQQACMNDEWLRQRVLKLNYLSAPAVRKWFKNGEWINKELSYGYGITNQGDISFNTSIEKRVYIDFENDANLIDWDKTDAVIMSELTGETEIEVFKTNDELTEQDYDETGQLIEYDNQGNQTGIVNDYETLKRGELLHWCQLPYENEANKKTYTTTKTIPGQTEIIDNKTGTTGNKNVNSAWYVGFNKSKNYYVRPDWLNDWRDSEIPSVARGQTFKAEETGKLASVNLVLDYTGTQSSDCGSPLYVQIWSTKEESQPKTVWNTRTKEMVKTGTYEKVPVPDTSKCGIYKPLAEAVHNPSKMSSFGDVNIKFDKECQLTKGQSYFLALFSPLSEWKHCPRWGGWGRNCAKDKKYEYGNAFLSEDNGRTWIRYGRNDRSVAYKLGKYVPQDFAFTCHIRTRDKIDTRTETKITLLDKQIDDADEQHPRYLYLKPIYCNPLKSIHIDSSNDVPTDTKLVYQYSFDGHEWNDIVLGSTISTEDIRPQVVFVRVALSRDIGEDTQTTVVDGVEIHHSPHIYSTPKIYNINIILNTDLPLSMYVRSHMWQPRTDAMLGARIWGRVYAPFETDPTVNCNVEIVTNETPTDHYTLIEVDDVLRYCVKKLDESKYLDETYESPIKRAIQEFTNNASEYVGTQTVTENNQSVNVDVYIEDLNTKTTGEIAEYLFTNQDVIEELKKNNVYILPYQTDNHNTDNYLYLLSFNSSENESMKINLTTGEEEYKLGGLDISNEVAYPILECTYTPENSTTDVTSFGEWYDYTFDYDTNMLYFRDDLLSQFTLGDVAITYNKCFIRNLTYDEVGIHTNIETGLKEEGLILDYFKESITITDEMVETRRVKLRVEPVDPIREVVLNRDTDKETELFEGFDYTVDIDTHEIIFNVTNVDGISSVLSVGDIVDIVYTPNLQATALALGYWCTRTNKDKQVRIKDSYWEYKA